jgi:SAM-dependent methyltransferase
MKPSCCDSHLAALDVERPSTCLGAAFEERYQSNPDPWNFAASAYERQRYRKVLEALPRARYARAFEPGCSVGELTARLAELCEWVIATDLAPTAVARARRRCRTLINVDIHCADIVTQIPPGPFDLIVFSELGYYFSRPLLGRVARALALTLESGGDFIAVHWLGESRDHVLHGDAVHAELMATLPLRWLRGERHAGFRIDCWRRA